MFPSGGYFRGANCPFFQHGLCHRPYCHFRHTKPEYKPSSTTNITKKTTDPEKKECSEIEKPFYQLQPSINKKVAKDGKSTIKDEGDKIEQKAQNEPCPSTKSIFKRTALEEKLIAFSSNTNEVLSDSDSDEMPQKDPGLTEIADVVIGTDNVVDKTKSSVSKESTLTVKDNVSNESPVSVTHSETTKISNPEIEDTAVNKKAVAENLKYLIREKDDVLPCEEIEMIKSENATEEQNLEKKKPHSEFSINKFREPTDVLMSGNNDNKSDEEVKEIEKSKSGMNRTKKSAEVKEGKNLNKMIEDLQKYGKGANIEVKTKKEVHKNESKKISKTKLKTEPPKLTDVNFFSANVVKKSKKSSKETMNEKKDSNKVKKEVKSEGMSKERKKLKKKLSESKLAITKEKSKIQRYKELKKLVKDSETVTDSGNTLVSSGKSDAKKSKTSEKLNELARTSKVKISAPKDSGKNSTTPSGYDVSEKKEVTKGIRASKKEVSDYGEISGKKGSSEKSERTKELKVIDSVKKNSVATEFGKKSLVTSDFSKSGEEMEYFNTEMDDGGEVEEDSEENELLRMFNDYDPADEPDNEDSMDINLISMAEKEESDYKPHSLPQSIGGIKRPSAETIPVGFKKQRVAHQPNLVIRRATASRSNSNAFRRLPRPLQGTLAPGVVPQAKPQGERDLVTSTHVKQRVTHYTKAAGTMFQRPRIRLEYGARVPQVVRQKYLDKLVDEYLCMYEDQQEAFDKAEKEEKGIYIKSQRRQMYINLCVNRIKTLRDAGDQSRDSSDVEAIKRNPLANKSTLPSPSKRLKIDTTSTNVVKVAQSIENSVTIKPNNKSVKSDEITEEEFYARMEKYVLTEEELVGNGYPRRCSIPGRAEINECYAKVKRNLNDPTRHICCRCGKPFVILESGEYQDIDECIYHHGRLLRNRTAGEIVTSYTCCQGESGCIGCSVAKMHVRATYWSEETGFIETKRNPKAGRKKIYALDCEMCYTTRGLELTRVTVVDYKCQEVYDTLVKPDNDIVDYNTRFSGIVEESMIGVTMSLRDVQSVLLSMFYKDTILLGHSLESDLRSLKVMFFLKVFS